MFFRTAKRAIIAAGNNPVLTRTFDWVRKRNVPILMMHRMRDDDLGIDGHDADHLDWALRYLTARGYYFLSLESLVSSIRKGEEIPGRAVVFTMDDGFCDQAKIACPIFEKHRCPVTVFLLGNLCSGIDWPWDYKVRYIVTNSAVTRVKFQHPKLKVDEVINNVDQRLSLMRRLREEIKNLKSKEGEDVVSLLSQAFEVPVSSEPPTEFRPINWDIARNIESEYVRFGPHTMSHVILKNEAQGDAEREISESFKILRQELANPVPIFCYPTGRYGVDFGDREAEIVEKNGFIAAVSTDAGYVDTGLGADDPVMYRLPRMPFPDNREDFIQTAGWIELLKQKIRG